ncbi:bifunctional 3'-5' exonuclease/DNA polymerase [uncultured Caudovirales phage]|uniref:DNA-directed DNA polymerase n=1 Tax=uncultured Caudovirales phage TaxID=2100421 RepID=A0A6J5P612_9CAUD|nr:bifunctional 3'-5' exonuclease/DNA polymerase [uncultured Caudovirales phage]
MGRRLYFDIETDGFLEQLTRIHSLVMYDLDTDETFSCADQPGFISISEGLSILADADMIVGHNSIKFDEPAIRKVRPQWTYRGTHEDTLVKAKLVIPKDTLRENDFQKMKRGFPVPLIGKYSLEAFGERLRMAGLGETKGDFKGPWHTWTPEMQTYCERDVRVGVALWRMLAKHYHCSPDALALEYATQMVIARQEQRGFFFDQPGAHQLYGTLVQRRDEVERELAQVFPPQYLRDGGEKAAYAIPKKDRRASVPELGVKVSFTAGCGYNKVRLTPFNPGSRVHIETWLGRIHGWAPTEFGADGHATVDDEIIRSLPWPEAKLLGEYLTIDKRLGQLAGGKQAWLLHVKADSCIRGAVDILGTATRRMTHFAPNIAQVPGLIDKKRGGAMPYGKECRALFRARPGYVLVGCDADALELRGLAGYLAKYDGGAYVETVLRGNKAAGTDMHTVNMKALGITSRDMAKTWFYAFIYGAGDEKLGLIVGAPKGSMARARGKSDRARFLKNLPAMKRLVQDLKDQIQRDGYIVTIDGARIPSRSSHSALNTLIQSMGAIVMKRALVILDAKLRALGLVPGVDYEFVANIHDEWQIEAREQHAEAIGKAAKQAIVEAGEYYSFGCPLDGNYGIGTTWADTH